jgi:hypothetical protein
MPNIMISTLKTWTVTQTNVEGKHKKCQNIFGQNMKHLYVINEKNHSSSDSTAVFIQIDYCPF